MRILAIETSCDETSAAVVEKIEDQTVRVLSNITATSLAIHASTGGIIPENAAREQVKFIIPVIREALQSSVLGSQLSENSQSVISKSVSDKQKTDKPVSENSPADSFQSGSDIPEIHYEKQKTDNRTAQEILENDIDAIAVTFGPGLIGSLLIGVETVKTLAFTFNKPIIPVNHLLAHLFANFIYTPESLRGPKGRSNPSLDRFVEYDSTRDDKISFPFIGLIVSGGHTDLLLFDSLVNFKWLGGTRDDAAGEALDKIGRLLDLPYPSGPEIERRASQIQNTKNQIQFKSPMLGSDDFDFSFSGLKAEVSRFVKTAKDNKNLTEELTDHICSAVQQAIFKVLIKKTVQASIKYKCSTILLGGGVSANQTLLEKLKLEIGNSKLEISVYSPEIKYSTDNAAMIGAYAALNPVQVNWKQVESQPDLYFD